MVKQDIAHGEDAALLYDKGVLLRKAGQLDLALECFVTVVRNTEPITPTETDDAWIVPYQAEPSQLEAAAEKREHGKPVKPVMDYFTAAIYNIGCIHVMRDALPEARKYLDEALDLWPENIAIKLQASFVYARLKESGSAVAVLQEAEDLAPDNALVFRQLAWTYNEFEQYEKAETAARRALVIDPTLVDAIEELLYAQEQLGHEADAASTRGQLEAARAKNNERS